METTDIQNFEMDLMSITPDWFYQNIPWNKISKLCNVRAWQGLVKKGDETMAEHAVSFCLAVPYSEPTTGPLFAATFLPVFSSILSFGVWLIFKMKVKGFEKSFHSYLVLCVICLVAMFAIQFITNYNIISEVIALLVGAKA